MSITKRKDGRWCGVAEIPTAPGEKRKRKYVYGKTRKEAQIKLNKIKAEIDNGKFKANENTSFSSLLEQWFKIHSPKIAATTRELYRHYIDNKISPLLGSYKLNEIKPVILDNFYNDMCTKHSPNTVIKYHKLIHQVLKYAVKNEMLAINPADYVNLPKTKKYKPVVFDKKTFDKIWNSIKGTYDEIPFLLAGAVGLRRGEIFGLKWENVNFKNNTITINNTITRLNSYVEKKPKSEASYRTIMVSNFVMKALRDFRIREANISPYVCYKYKPDYYSSRFKNVVLKKAGVQSIRFHDLRHFNAVMMLKQNIPDKLAAERLGHSDTTMLKEVYQHTLEDMHKDALRKLDKAFNE